MEEPLVYYVMMTNQIFYCRFDQVATPQCSVQGGTLAAVLAVMHHGLPLNSYQRVLGVNRNMLSAKKTLCAVLCSSFTARKCHLVVIKLPPLQHPCYSL